MFYHFAQLPSPAPRRWILTHGSECSTYAERALLLGSLHSGGLDIWHSKTAKWTSEAIRCVPDRVRQDNSHACCATLIMSRQHNVVPEPPLVSRVTHVALAFMRSEVFNVPQQDEWPLFTSVADVRPKFAKGTKIQVAIGGWGNTDGFLQAAKTNESRRLFARNIKAMIDATGTDGGWYCMFLP